MPETPRAAFRRAYSLARLTCRGDLCPTVAHRPLPGAAREAAVAVLDDRGVDTGPLLGLPPRGLDPEVELPAAA